MWFKNLQLFRFASPFEVDESRLSAALEARSFRPCGPLEPRTFGWTAPAGRGSDRLVHVANGCLLLAARREDKLLPAAVVNELVAERTAALEDAGRRLPKRERQRIREETIYELLPRALCRSRRTYAYLAPAEGWLVVDAASRKMAEELSVLLRKSLGSLPVTEPRTMQGPPGVMTCWLQENRSLPAGLDLDDECELRSPDADGSQVRCRHQDLAAPEVASHLEAGKEAVKLALTWHDRISFVLDETLALRRLRFLDIIQDQAAEAQTDDERERFDADFTIMTLELAPLLKDLLEWFGGEDPTALEAARHRLDAQAPAASGTGAERQRPADTAADQPDNTPPHEVTDA